MFLPSTRGPSKLFRSAFNSSWKMLLQPFRCRLFFGIYKTRALQLTAQIKGEHARTLSSLISKSHRPAIVAIKRLNPLQSERWFWGIDVAFNKVDEERVKLAGADRAAAEWVLKNGGSIKWTTSTNKLADYNLLPGTSFESYKLEEIDLTATDVIDLGFEHLKDLQHLRKVTLHGCRSIGDDAVQHLKYVQDTLECLEISRCPMITEKGLNVLTEFKKLKNLVLYDLIEIRNVGSVASSLKKAMPWCQIDTTDPMLSKPAAKEN